MDEQNPLDTIYDSPTPAPAPKPKPKKRKIPKKKAVMVKRKPKPVPPLPTTYRLNLTIRHTINGQPYGPGLVEVDGEIGRVLIENEQRNLAEERGLKEERAHMIFSGGRTVQVPVDFFDNPDAMLGAPVAFSQSFKGFKTDAA